jgi:hypothetical protein
MDGMVKLFMCLFKHNTMKTYPGEEVKLLAFLTSSLDLLNGQLHASAALFLMKEPSESPVE